MTIFSKANIILVLEKSVNINNTSLYIWHNNNLKNPIYKSSIVR